MEMSIAPSPITMVSTSLDELGDITTICLRTVLTKLPKAGANGLTQETIINIILREVTTIVIAANNSNMKLGNNSLSNSDIIQIIAAISEEVVTGLVTYGVVNVDDSQALKTSLTYSAGLVGYITCIMNWQHDYATDLILDAEKHFIEVVVVGCFSCFGVGTKKIMSKKKRNMPAPAIIEMKSIPSPIQQEMKTEEKKTSAETVLESLSVTSVIPTIVTEPIPVKIEVPVATKTETPAVKVEIPTTRRAVNRRTNATLKQTPIHWP